MSDSNSIVNKVSQSGLITLDLSEWIEDASIVDLDIKNQLFQGLVLKEKDFRSWVKAQDWKSFSDLNVGVYCSTIAIVPTWAYMLLANVLSDHAQNVFWGDKKAVKQKVLSQRIAQIDVEDFRDKKIVVKGCGDVDLDAYVQVTSKLKPVVASLMFGEPCSTVPVYKRKKN